ncbi:hypothetical protein D3C73_1269290 [compost metagenome]
MARLISSTASTSSRLAAERVAHNGASPVNGSDSTNSTAMNDSNGSRPRQMANSTWRVICIARCWVRPISTPKPASMPVARAMKASLPNSSWKKSTLTIRNSAAHNHSSSQVKPVNTAASTRVRPFCQARSNSAP